MYSDVLSNMLISAGGIFLFKEDIDTYDLYKDICMRTNGEIYIGVVGPVRTGKSTFIKRFMEQMVLPNISNENDKKRALDELPQSGNGKTIMTTEPKFIPKEATKVQITPDCSVNVRLIDCVGYMVNSATGFVEEFKERMVKTPWSEDEMPFTKAAHIGTQKVIKEHSTIGIVVTTDGSIGDIERDKYIEAEERVINELKSIGKPFVVLLNTINPFGKEAIEIAKKIEESNKVTVIPCNCEQLRTEDITKILQKVLYEFPISEIAYEVPNWVDMLGIEHQIMSELLANASMILEKVEKVKDVIDFSADISECHFISNISIGNISMNNGKIQVNMEVKPEFYYDVLSEMSETTITNEYELVKLIKELSARKAEFEKVSQAIESVKATGYGFVTAAKNEIILEEPELIKNGNKYGVKIEAKAPSIHMINAQIETQIAPIVGSKEQAEDLIKYIKSESEENQGIWETNIFGKTIEQIVDNGISEKIHNMTNENVDKIRDTLQKVMNDNSGLVCLIV